VWAWKRAEVVISEYGIDLSKFPTEGEFVSHVKLAPHRPVSGGKVLKKKRGRQTGTRTSEALRNAATLIYRMLRWGQAYVDAGQEVYERQYEAVRIRTLASTAAQLGYGLTKNQAVSG
jgi:hypothetical protein